MHFSTLLANSTCSSPEVVLAFLLYEGSTIHNASDQFTSCVYFSSIPHRQKSDLYTPNSNSCIFTPTENWTHVYMNLFTRNSPYYHLLKYLLFLLKHPVYMCVYVCVCVCMYIYVCIYIYIFLYYIILYLLVTIRKIKRRTHGTRITTKHPINP